MIINELFMVLESVETQSSIETLSRMILSEIVHKTVMFHNQKLTFWEFSDHSMAGTNLKSLFPNGKGLTKLPVNVRAFVKANPTLRIGFDGLKNGVRGQFSAYSNEVLLSLSEKSIETIKSLISDKYFTVWNLSRIVLQSSVFETLVHELTHAYDNWASSGKYKENVRSKEAQKSRGYFDRDWMRDQQKVSLYLNDPIEINARYAAVVAKLNLLIPNVPWNTILNNFKYEFLGWKSIPEDEQRRLIKRLAQEWTSKRKEIKRDYKEEFDAFYAGLRSATGLQTYMNYSFSSNALIVDSFGTDDPSKISVILKSVIYFADVRKLIVGLEDVKITPALREMGFVPNKNSKRNFRLHYLVTIYRPARTEFLIKKRP